MEIDVLIIGAGAAGMSAALAAAEAGATAGRGRGQAGGGSCARSAMAACSAQAGRPAVSLGLRSVRSTAAAVEAVPGVSTAQPG